jgi:dipeptidyl aminopeptidase/acylaminoacyl peptidase
MDAGDLELLQSVGRPALSPDGRRAIVAVSHPSFAADSDVGQLWEVPLDGSSTGTAPRRFTRGSEDFAPAFSPDGRVIAFLRAGDGAPQLQVMDARGGEPVAVTDQKLGVSQFTWTPDSRSLVYVSRVAEEGRYGTVDKLGPAAEPPRRITVANYRANGLGYTIDRRAQLFVVEAPAVDGEPVYERAPEVGEAPKVEKVPTSRQLTHDDADHGSPAVTADGGHVVFVAALHATRDDDLRSDIWRLPLAAPAEGAPAPELERLTDDDPLDVVQVQLGPDGRAWFLGSDLGPSGLDFVARNGAVYLIDGGAVRRLTDPEEHDVVGMVGELTVESASSVLVQDSLNGRTPLLRVDDAGTVTTLTSGDVEVTGHATAAGAIVAAIQTPDSSGELARIDTSGMTTLTDFGAPLRSRGLVTPRELTVTARDGYPVHGWVAVPAGEGPHPVLLMIHGGPYTQYSIHLFDETQVYADAGYAVVYCNPRGSSGYGQEHGRVIKEAMGTVDLDDVLDFLDGAVAQHPELDGSRVGILGGSYGGYLTAWTIAHDHRWAGAIVERGYLDPEFFIGTSDIGAFFSDAYTGDTPEKRATQSPQAFVHQVTTPTLVLHSELDLRCPVAQAERYYLSLKRGGVPTELVLFPGENHELSRGGRPRHRRQRFDIILDWWNRMLPVGS